MCPRDSSTRARSATRSETSCSGRSGTWSVPHGVEGVTRGARATHTHTIATPDHQLTATEATRCGSSTLDPESTDQLSRSFVGPGLASGSAGTTVPIQYEGDCPADITRLGVGPTSAVYVDDNGDLKRLGNVPFTRALEVVGTCDEMGNAMLAFASPTAPYELNVLDFGAVGDGVTDDLPAFKAALAGFGSVNPMISRGGRIRVPPGNYRLNGDLPITIECILEGASGGNGHGASRPQVGG